MRRAFLASLLVAAAHAGPAAAQAPPAPAPDAAVGGQASYGTADRAPPAEAGARPATVGPQQVAVSRLKELKLYTVQGQSLGDVERVVEGGEGVRLVVAHGGFLGLGERQVLVPASRVALRDDRLVAQTLSDDELRALPTVGRGDPSLRDLDNAHQVPVGSSP
jgi:sporulation protein YlmC with PRC-barrel domain